MTCLSPAELEARLRLHCLPQLGPKRFRRLFSAFDSASAALSAPASAWRALGLPASSAAARRCDEVRERAAAALAWLEQPGQQLLMFDDDNYPALLAELDDAPPLLFVQGDARLLERPQLALVGSRNASRPGLQTAEAFARSLASAGFVITSGLALGIDGAAHQGALQVGGRTVAVLGTGLCQIYPPRHKALALRIAAEGGALVSELPLDSAPQASNFPRRNRIISGLSLGVLVVEAGLASGSLITARLAAEQGREVWAIPGSIHHPGAKGCHQLIRDGAQLVERVDDLLQSLHNWQYQPPAAAVQPELPVSESPLLALLHAAPQSSESLAAASGQSLPEVLAQLTELELSGAVQRQQTLWLACSR